MALMTIVSEPSRRSWIESANLRDCDFPIQNLPYGVFSWAGSAPRCGVALGDQVIDLGELEAIGLIDAGAPVFATSSLNSFMGRGPSVWAQVRRRLVELLSEGGDRRLFGDRDLRARTMLPADKVRMHMPFKVEGYTDFYAGRHHATTVGVMFRGAENALPQNWLSIPIGYNGRASTVVVSGTDFRRPLGQKKSAAAELPVFGPSPRLDFELEMGAVVGMPSRFGEPITVAEADAMIFGYVLLNDWSARDIQAWEYQPLGPFQAKAFATSISPWVVPKAALEPFAVAAPKRDRPLLPYLRDQGRMFYDIRLEVKLQPEGAARATTITRTNSRELYYSAAQQLAHHAVSGCLMNTGDLLGSGTISGSSEDSCGSLLELTWGGAEPLTLDTGEVRTFLEDGDTVTFSAWAEGEDYRVGFGECVGKVLPAPAEPPWLGDRENADG